MSDRGRRWAAMLPKLGRAVVEEAGPLLSKRFLAESARLLPEQSFNRTRTALLRAAGVSIGEQSQIQGPVRITGTGNPCQYLSIGAFTIISGPLYIDLGAPVRIGDGVRIGHDVSLLTISHAVGSKRLRAGPSESWGITVGDGAWLASRVTVLAKVSVGAGAIVAAGSVVTRDVPPNTLVAGVPARVVRTLETSSSLED